jgi:hypothetical protein
VVLPKTGKREYVLESPNTKHENGNIRAPAESTKKIGHWEQSEVGITRGLDFVLRNMVRGRAKVDIEEMWRWRLNK